MRQLAWIKCNDGPCDFEHVNLNGVTAQGVYMIWYRGHPGRVVRIGQGNIADRLRAHRQDENILVYRQQRLFVSWAEVAPALRNGIEKYLAVTYPPLIGNVFPDAPPIPVDAPWT